MIVHRIALGFAATLSLGVLSASVNKVFAADTHHETFAEPNDLNLEDNLMFAANMTETEFNKIVDDIVTQYKPLAKSHGGNLSANKNWTDSTVNASANQFFGMWSVNMYGGLARRSEVTPDGFAMVICHELGHHFGGFPFVGGNGWAANEGEADYFAMHSCAEKIWANQKTENATHRATASEIVKEKCNASWATVETQDLCYRIADAGQSLASLLAAIKKESEPHYETPDANVVAETEDGHPAAQCRMDTYLAGMLCTLPFDEKVIPARKNSKGEGSMDAEKESAKYICTSGGNFKVGLRPACWFKARY